MCVPLSDLAFCLFSWVIILLKYNDSIIVPFHYIYIHFFIIFLMKEWCNLSNGIEFCLISLCICSFSMSQFWISLHLQCLLDAKSRFYFILELHIFRCRVQQWLTVKILITGYKKSHVHWCSTTWFLFLFFPGCFSLLQKPSVRSIKTTELFILFFRVFLAAPTTECHENQKQPTSR